MALRRFFSYLLAAAAVFLAVIVLSRRKVQRPRTKWPSNLAHRGSSLRAPENTVEAFRLAVEEGAEGLELDVHMSRDGGIIVIHDYTVDRTTDGIGPVREKLLSEIKSLDAGYRFSFDGGYSFPYRGKRLGVPTLEEVYRRFPQPVVNVEIKEDLPDIEEAVLRVIKKAGAEDRTLVAAQMHGVNRRFRKVSRGLIPTSASKFEIGLFYLLSRLWLERVLKPAYTAIQIPRRHLQIELLTTRFVTAAHDRGVRIDVWTVDDPDEMHHVLNLGVDVIMTNRPRLLAEVLEQRQVH
ncbi:glycerophosphodiester phosphodiesterase [soil metagenome]